MSKYIIEYDEVTGMATDNSGAMVGAYMGAVLTPYDESATSNDIDVMACIRAGMSADDIVRLRDAGIV